MGAKLHCPDLDQILERLDAVRPTPGGYSARCPAHDDKNPSLSVWLDSSGRVCLKCHAGCSTDVVWAQIGLDPSDKPLGKRAGTAQGNVSKPPRTFGTPSDAETAILTSVRRTLGDEARISGRWPYTNLAGEEVFRVVRIDSADGRKTYRPLHPTSGGWVIGDPKQQLPLYRLAELDAADLVIVVEGEKCVEALRSVGFAATTSAHGAGSAHKTDWSPLAGRPVVILPDHDAAGEKYGDEVSRILRGASRSNDVLIVRLPDLPDGGDIVDFIAARGSAGLSNTLVHAEIETLIVNARREREAVPESDEKAEPPVSGLKFVPFPLAALPKRARRIIQVAAQSIGCDPSFLAMSLLTVAASAIGNSTRILLKEGWSEPALIWTAIVAMSGQQKSPAMDVTVAPLSKFQARAFREYQDEFREFERAQKQHERELAMWTKKNSSGDPPTPPEEPVRRRYTCDDVTIEGLLPVLQAQPRGLLMHADELASWLRSFDRYRKGPGSDVPRWLSIHGCREVTIDRKTGDRFIYVPRPAVCVLGGVQPGTLRRLLTPDYFENGLAARLLVTMPPLRKRTWSDQGFPDAVRDDLQGIVERLLKLELSIDDDGLPVPKMLGLAPDAKELWIAFYNQHAEEQIQLDDSLAAAWSKLEAYAARIALVLHCLRDACGERVESAVVDTETMDAAISITRWCANEARRVYAALKESDEEGATRSTLERIRACGGSTTVRDWQRARSIKTAAETRKQLNQLVLSGDARWVREPVGSDGGHQSEICQLIDKTSSDTCPPGGVQQGQVSVSEVSEGSFSLTAADGRARTSEDDDIHRDATDDLGTVSDREAAEVTLDTKEAAPTLAPASPESKSLRERSDSTDTDTCPTGAPAAGQVSDANVPNRASARPNAELPRSPQPKQKAGTGSKRKPCPTCGTASFVWLEAKRQWVCVKCVVASVAESADPEGSTETGEWVDA
ncbi:MAG: DUF3987 domain-containing protein [Planctomycetes bacterium]|nr:DUF3987 domain-containing protein [Planctomycetota bacterium]